MQGTSEMWKDKIDDDTFKLSFTVLLSQPMELKRFCEISLIVRSR